MEKIQNPEYDFDVADEVETIYKGKKMKVTIKYIGSDGLFNGESFHQSHYVIAEDKTGKELAIDPSQTTKL